MVTDMHDDNSLRHQCASELQAAATKALDEPPYQEHKGAPVGLGISLDIDAESLNEPVYQEQEHDEVDLGITMSIKPEWNQKHTEAYSFDECNFGTELNKWTTVFDDSDGDDDNAHDVKGH